MKDTRPSRTPSNTETPQPTSQPTSPNTEVQGRIVKVIPLSIEFTNSLINYLGTKPYAEVANFIEPLRNTPGADLTLNDAPKGN